MSSDQSPTAQVAALFEAMEAEQGELREQLSRVEQMFQLEDRQWKEIWGGLDDENVEGLTLKQVKDVSNKIREMIVGSPIIDRGTALRASYIWSKGLSIPGAEDVPGKRGRKTAVSAFYKKSKSQRYLFGADAHDEMERSAATDGTYMLLGDNTSKDIHPVPIREIHGIYVNPDYAGDVWAYKRVWSTIDTTGKVVERQQWYYVDTFEGKKEKYIGPKEDRVAVDDTKTLIPQNFNTQTGWPLGVPDALAAIVWAKIYSELLNHGKVMTEALAKFALKVTTPTQNGANKVGVKMAGSAPSGQTAALGVGQDLVPLSSAGKAYDFNGIRPVAAMVATALEVSIVHLLSDPGAAGSSYGSASNLDLPTKRAMVARQNTWSAYISRVIKWATGEAVDVRFPNLDDPDPYREMQLQAIAWGTGLIHEDEARGGVLEAASMTSEHDSAPEGVMLPNNVESMKRADVDADGTTSSNSAATSGASPDQGRSNNSGGARSGGSSDLQQAMARLDLDRFEALIERMEALKVAS